MVKTANIEITNNPEIMKKMVNEAAIITIASVMAEVDRQMRSANNEIEYDTLNHLNVWLKQKMDGI